MGQSESISLYEGAGNARLDGSARKPPTLSIFLDRKIDVELEVEDLKKV